MEKYKMENKKKNFVMVFLSAVLIFSIIVFIFYAKEGIAAETPSVTNAGGGEIVSVNDVLVCCEKTKSGLACQEAKDEQCDTSNGLRKLPTSCRSSSFCNPGWCFDSEEGICLDNTAQVVCNSNKGTWTAKKPAQCNLGCCILADQGSFVTLTRCKRLSSFYGLETNFNLNIENEAACILIAAGKEKGACVFMKDFEKTCKLTTREDCTADNMYNGGTQTAQNTSQQGGASTLGLKQNTNSGTGTGGTGTGSSSTTNTGGSSTTTTGTGGNTGGTGTGTSGSTTGHVVANNISEVKEGEVKFYPGKLCSAEELGTNCGLTKQTACLPGKEEVYFVDTCGNPANIYDASKVNDKSYWANILDKSKVCNPEKANQNSPSCGNCNYLMGSYCREAKDTKATYGDNICADLNCKDVNGKKRLHGESWCGFDTPMDFSPVKQEGNYLTKAIDDAMAKLNSKNPIGASFFGTTTPVGSKFYRYQCNNGKIIVEPCADFRQEECIEDSINTPQGKFSEAACRVNRWQDCTAQKDTQSCENSDKRDCKWLDGIEYTLIGAGANGSTFDANSLAQIKQTVKAAGGLKNMPKGACVPKISPGLNFWEGNEAKGICAQANAVCPVTYEKKLLGGDWKCKGAACQCLEESAQLKRVQLCMSLGDCGPKTNYLGKIGNTKGYKITQQNLKK